MTASTIAQQTSCTVFTVVSTCTVLLAQLTGPFKLNPKFSTLVKESPSLGNWFPKNKIASPGARSTASVIHSSRPSWNMSAISNPLHAWEGGGWSPLPSPNVTLM